MDKIKFTVSALVELPKVIINKSSISFMKMTEVFNETFDTNFSDASELCYLNIEVDNVMKEAGWSFNEETQLYRKKDYEPPFKPVKEQTSIYDFIKGGD